MPRPILLHSRLHTPPKHPVLLLINRIVEEAYPLTRIQWRRQITDASNLYRPTMPLWNYLSHSNNRHNLISNIKKQRYKIRFKCIQCDWCSLICINLTKNIAGLSNIDIELRMVGRTEFKSRHYTILAMCWCSSHYQRFYSRIRPKDYMQVMNSHRIMHVICTIYPETYLKELSNP